MMKGSAALTTSWDDGHPLDQRVAELLAKYGLSGTFYVTFENSRPVMTPGETRRLGEGFEIGAHTVHHADLTKVSSETAENEISQSKKRLENLMGRPCEAFCFPRGRFRARHLEMVRRAGFRCARTVELLSTRFPRFRVGIFLIPTTVQAAPAPWTVYARNCAKRLAVRNLVNFALYTRSRDWMETAHSMLQVVADSGGVFHLWGHSWEIEEHHQWAKLEQVFREMKALRSAVPCVPNSRLVTPAGIARGEVDTLVGADDAPFCQ